MSPQLPLVLLAVVLFVAALLYNGLIRRRNRVELAFATVDALLKKRHDLVPNLTAAVGGAMTHERALLTRLTELRSRAASLDLSQAPRVQAESELGGTLGALVARVEAYPELGANENVLHLQASLNEVEEQISAARRFYNATVADYNTAVESVPWNLVASAARMPRRAFFTLPEVERTARPVGGPAR
jgi:LemA protein